MTVLSSELLHATAVAIDGRAILIEGLSGSGKSDLALRLIDRGAQLISDDYTLVMRVENRLIAKTAPNIAGKIEIRGIGLVALPHISDIPVALILSLGIAVDRMPTKGQNRNIAGVIIPWAALNAFETSAAIKAEYALHHFGL